MFPAPATPQLSGWCHLIYFGLIIPAMIIRQRDLVVAKGCPLPNRIRHFRVTSLMLGMFGLVSLGVAFREHIDLFPAAWPSWTAILAGAGFYVFALIVMRPRWRRAVESRERIIYLFMPQTAPERTSWIGVATLAGFTEEITWRGVQFALMMGFVGNPWLAMVLCSISFGLAHAVQGWKSVGIIMLFALGFHWLVWVAGSLYIAMAVHIAYDLTAGFAYGRLGKELHYELETPDDTGEIIQQLPS